MKSKLMPKKQKRVSWLDRPWRYYDSGYVLRVLVGVPMNEFTLWEQRSDASSGMSAEELDDAIAIGKLIAAAPDLLHAAKLLADLDSVGYNPAAITANGSGYPKAIYLLRAAIAKAEGRGD